MVSPFRSFAIRVVMVATICALAIQGASAGVQSALDAPSAPSNLAARSALLAVARVGNRVVAAGRMGHIVYTDNGGETWVQASVPVSVDLVALHFVSDKTGWATGHDGVVLRTDDAGASWSKLLDGKGAAEKMLAYYQQLAEESNEGEPYAAELAEAKRFIAEEGARPFLDVWFRNANEGFVVGAWGLILHTIDGGRSWEPWLHRIENPMANHLYAIQAVDGEPWIVGERGRVYRFEGAEARFVSVTSPTEGSLFGLAVSGQNVIVFGLLGRAFVSSDGGASWRVAQTPGQVGVAAGTAIAPHSVVLADTGGGVWISRDDGANFSALPMQQAMPWAGVEALGNGGLALVGVFGGVIVPRF